MISMQSTQAVSKPALFTYDSKKNNTTRSVVFSGNANNDDYTPRHQKSSAGLVSKKDALLSSFNNTKKKTWLSRASVVAVPLIALGSLVVVRDDFKQDTHQAIQNREQLMNENGALQPERTTLQDNVVALNSMLDDIHQLQVDTTAVEAVNGALETEQEEKQATLNEWVLRIDDAQDAIQDIENTLGLPSLTVDDYILMEDASGDQLTFRLQRIVTTLTNYSDTNDELQQELQLLIDSFGLGF